MIRSIDFLCSKSTNICPKVSFVPSISHIKAFKFFYNSNLNSDFMIKSFFKTVLKISKIEAKACHLLGNMGILTQKILKKCFF